MAIATDHKDAISFVWPIKKIKSIESYDYIDIILIVRNLENLFESRIKRKFNVWVHIATLNKTYGFNFGFLTDIEKYITYDNVNTSVVKRNNTTLTWINQNLQPESYD